MSDKLLQLLADVPPMLIAAWTAWFIAGGMLAMWYRRAPEMEFAPAPAPRSVARSRPATQPASSMTTLGLTARESVEQLTVIDEAPARVRDKRAPTPVVSGDPFGDLATLLDQPAPASFRTPGESPILNSAGSPMLRDQDPKLG
ncbi:MAG: hypothetical protein ACRD1W_22495 [Vicinamibacterales bacterium]